MENKANTPKSISQVSVSDVVLKINSMTVNLDDQTVSKLLEIIDLLYKNQIILLDKIDHIEISIVEQNKIMDEEKHL